MQDKSKRPLGWGNLTTTILANCSFPTLPISKWAVKIQSPLAFHCRSDFQKQSNLIFHPNKPQLWSYKDKGFPQKSKQQAMQEKNLKNNKVNVKSLSRVWLFVTPWSVAYQAPLSTGFSRQEYWSGVPFPSPGDLPYPGIEPASLMSPALAGRSVSPGATWEAFLLWVVDN